MSLKSELLEILACPKCKQQITLSDDGKSIVCLNCRLRFPIRDDIPVLLIDEAVSGNLNT